MAKTGRLQAQSDPLRNDLDKLAAKLVKKAMDDPEATVRTLSDALKVAGAFYHMSRKPTGKDEAPADAWSDYTQSFMTAEVADGKAN